MQSGKRDAIKKYNQKQIDQLVNLIKMVQGELPKELRSKVSLISSQCHIGSYQ